MISAAELRSPKHTTRTLILGGTAWLGREIAEQSLARGEQVTCLARGEAGEFAHGVTSIRSDRREAGAYDQVAETRWDRVIELSYDADFVAGALAALADSAGHWTLVSSVSVYASNDEPDADEDAALVHPTDPGNYAHAKVAAERATMAAVTGRSLIVRPGLIVGPGDPSDRFGYWVSRLALAGFEQVLVPDARGRVAQIIDVRDLAAWVTRAAERGLNGTYNAVGSERDLAMVLQAAARVAGHTGQLVTAGDDWLTAHGVNFWAGPRSLPLCLPLSDTAFAQRSRTRYLAAGGTERALERTLEDVLAYERALGLDRERRAGLSRDDERDLLSELVGRAHDEP